MVASDKLFFWLFQERSQRLQPLVASLLDDMEGYGFSAPAIKELEVREFLRERVIWVELAPDRLPANAPPLQRALGLLLLPEEQLPTSAASIREVAAETPLAAEVDTVIAAILVACFCGRSIPEICAMGGLTIDDFTSSAIYREIFGQGRSEGLQEGQREGRQAEATALTLRLLQRRCGPLTLQQQTQLQALPLERLQTLADALLDFQGPDDLAAWLRVNGT